MDAFGTMNLWRIYGQEEKIESPNLRDLLRIKEDESYNSGRSNFSGQTLDSILRLERGRCPVRVQSNRTLLDIIRDEPINSKDNNNRKSWRHFKRRLRNRLQGSDSDGPIRRRVITPRGDSTSTTTNQVNASSSVGSESDHPQAESSSSGGVNRNASEEAVIIQEETVEQPVRMSLMALLAETDRQMGFDGSVFVTEVEEGDKKEEEVEEKEKDGGGDQNCCVCMIRHKGAAFIPCGHTFCRLCCREIWVQRGNCPLCNSLILEILDIF